MQVFSQHVDAFGELAQAHVGDVARNRRLRAVVSKRLELLDQRPLGVDRLRTNDVAYGILSAIAPNTDDLTLATAAGAYINGAAGELAQNKRSDVSMTASDTASCIAEVIESIINR